MRLFMALELPSDIREELRRYQQHAKYKKISTVRWVDRDRMHLTLVFLGETRADLLPGLRRLSDEAASECEPFELHVRGIGAFGPPDRPRVLWAGVTETQRVLELQGQLEARLDATGFMLRDHQRAPHITLGRVTRHGADLDAWLNPFEPQFGAFRVQKLSLIRSLMAGDKVEYTTLHESWLEG
jgi:RNA 2',3'-cyclic 3'-phosphodiesterase